MPPAVRQNQALRPVSTGLSCFLVFEREKIGAAHAVLARGFFFAGAGEGVEILDHLAARETGFFE
ncbi:MAG: hypothetical protein F9K47_12455 [Burkholderiales bacterium]|nr:MAG: hypothetical protein F9K47_12455 [Burkholderiales bacterium]